MRYYKSLTSSPPAWDTLEIQTVIANPAPVIPWINTKGGNLNYQNARQLSLPFVSISHVEGIKPRIGPIAPNEDNRRTVHVSQPNTTRQGLWIGPHVFHMKFDKIEVRVNTNRIYHRRLYTLHFLAFRHDKSRLSSSSWGLSLVKSPCKRLLFSSSSILLQQRDEKMTSLLFFSLKNIAWQATRSLFGRGRAAFQIRDFEPRVLINQRWVAGRDSWKMRHYRSTDLSNNR